MVMLSDANNSYSCGVYFLLVGLLQFAALRSARHSTAQAAVCAECHCTTDHWHATQWSYLAGVTWTPLVTYPRACQVQSDMPGSLLLFRQAPLYLADDCRLVSDSTRHSAVSWRFDLLVLRTLSSYGDRTFVAIGPCLWNSLAVQLRNPYITYGLLRRQLKGHLFREAWTWYSVTSDMWRHRKTLTYLLTAPTTAIKLPAATFKCWCACCMHCYMLELMHTTTLLTFYKQQTFFGQHSVICA